MYGSSLLPVDDGDAPTFVTFSFLQESFNDTCVKWLLRTGTESRGKEVQRPKAKSRFNHGPMFGKVGARLRAFNPNILIFNFVDTIAS